jgi:hypothetical protein
MNDSAQGTVETIDIPVVPREFPAEKLNALTSIEVEEIPEPVGHFSVDYRRC